MRGNEKSARADSGSPDRRVSSDRARRASSAGCGAGTGHLGTQHRVAGVGVDEAFFEPVECQTEAQVVVDEIAGKIVGVYSGSVHTVAGYRPRRKAADRWGSTLSECRDRQEQPRPPSVRVVPCPGTAADGASGDRPRPESVSELDRKQWRDLRRSMPMVLNEHELEQLTGLGEQIDLTEVAEVYLPLSRLIHLQVAARQRLFAATSTFLGERQTNRQVPFVIGIAGSVAVGKSTTARVLAALLARWESHPKVDLVTTDGFLLPTAEMQRRGIMHRKGFPESYDRRALLRFVTEVKSGAREVTAPVYSHITYDIVPDVRHYIRQPDILILRGSTYYRQVRRSPCRTCSISRCMWTPRPTTSNGGTSHVSCRCVPRHSPIPIPHFHLYSSLSDDQAHIAARDIWTSINRPNLIENILPTRPRATLVLRKDSDHSINRVRLRKI